MWRMSGKGLVQESRYVPAMAKRLGEDCFLFRGVCCFPPRFCYFLCVLFGGIWKFCIFAGSKGCYTHWHPEYMSLTIN